MVKVIAVLIALSLSGCAGVSSFIPSTGTNVAANTQLGKTNTQTLGTTTLQEFKTDIQGSTGNSFEQTQRQDNTVRTEKVESLTVNEAPLYLLVLLVLGWLLPSPQEIIRMIKSALKPKL